MKIGYWKSPSEPDLPDPVPGTWNPTELAAVIAYLKRGLPKHHWKGWSNCRLCGIHNGSRCLTDGAYTWPEGLPHYLEAHSVTLPRDFVDHVLKAPHRN